MSESMLDRLALTSARSEGMAEAFGKEVQHGIDAIKKVIGME